MTQRKLTRRYIPGDEIIQAYRETGSVWRAGKKIGMSGQKVHSRLVAIGYPLASREWTQEEEDELRALLEGGVTLGETARRLGRPYAGAAMKASRLGIKTKRAKNVKLPRGAGFDKASVKRHMDALDRYDGLATRYARANGLEVELLVQAIQKHFPERWTAYVEAHSDLPSKDCPYCGVSFIPMSGKQNYCTRKCGNDARRDEQYFGGRRRETIGLASGICQLCEEHKPKGLSSHHVIGKENDPDNDLLVALCPGCHKLVTLAASRKFVMDSAAWENLISLVCLRKHGGLPEGHDTIEVCVDIETYANDDELEEAA